MIWFKLFIMIISATLFWIGGAFWHNARRFIMPVVLTFSCVGMFLLWWPLTMLTAIGPLCLGYGDKSPLRHCFGNGWGRGVWGLLVALCLSLGMFLTGHIAWYLFVTYLAINFTLENALKDLPQEIGDPIIGCGFSSIVFFIHGIAYKLPS